MAIHYRNGCWQRYLDKPASVLESLYASEIYIVIGAYETRAIVKSVKLSSIDEEGNVNNYCFLCVKALNI